VPQDLQADRALRHLLGDFARSVAGEASRYVEAAGVNPADVIAYVEIRPGHDGPLKSRTADLPLALGEAVMTNNTFLASTMPPAAISKCQEALRTLALSNDLRVKALRMTGPEI
jgi:hypothetical protein